MADINIEKKSSNKPVWPWILGLLVLIGVIWGIAEMTDNEPERDQMAVAEEPYEQEPIATDPQANRLEENPQTQSFVLYINESDVKDRIAEDHQVTGEALMRLSGALEGLSQNNGAHTQQIEEIRQTAQQIQTSAQSEQHAGMVKSAFTTAANVLGQIQQNQFPDAAESEVQDLQETSRELKVNEQLSEQKDDVEDFFEKAADAIEKMEEQQASM